MEGYTEGKECGDCSPFVLTAQAPAVWNGWMEIGLKTKGVEPLDFCVSCTGSGSGSGSHNDEQADFDTICKFTNEIYK